MSSAPIAATCPHAPHSPALTTQRTPKLHTHSTPTSLAMPALNTPHPHHTHKPYDEDREHVQPCE
eukprot:3938492-Rhodomonas_salina.1